MRTNTARPRRGCRHDPVVLQLANWAARGFSDREVKPRQFIESVPPSPAQWASAIATLVTALAR
jgi:hypothetical protein